MNIFSLHYFLWFGALTPIYGYVSVYAEHYANASSSQYGLLNMVLPFVTIVSNIFVCSLADRHQAHRVLLLVLLVTTLVGYSSYGILPFFVESQPKASGLNQATWLLICIITTISTISMGAIACLSDTLAMNSSRRRNTSYGRIRVWGTLGWGLGSLVISFTNQSPSLPLLVPGLIVTAVLILTDLLAVSLWPHREDFKLEPYSKAPAQPEATTKISADQGYGTESSGTSSSCSSAVPEVSTSSIEIQWRLFKEVARRRKSIFLYMGLFALSGALISLQWSYFFLYLKDIYTADFAFITGFTMLVDSVLGEMPFFLLSEYVICGLGKTHTLALSFVSMGGRFLLYEYLLPNSSKYLVIVPGMLQGPSFGLFYVVMTEVANDYAKCEEAIRQVMDENKQLAKNSANEEKLSQALRATMQSIVSSCYEGLGLGIGSIVGGVVIQHYGFHCLWFYSALLSLLAGVATSVSVFVFTKRVRDIKESTQDC